MLNLEIFKINKGEMIISALEKIDKNKKKFLIVVEEGQVVGTLTDGDLRRALINGKTLNDKVDQGIYSSNFLYLYEDEKYTKAINIFKVLDKAIEFIPIVDKSMKLTNIITKQNMHSLLLRNVNFNLKYDFLAVDDSVLDHNIYERPWGFYKTTVLNDFFQSKVLHIFPKHKLSLQKHKRREEYWIVVHGQGIATIGESKIQIYPGSSLFIPKGCKHRLENTSDNEALIITEVQLGDFFGEEDIIRYEDEYGRV